MTDRRRQLQFSRAGLYAFLAFCSPTVLEAGDCEPPIEITSGPELTEAPLAPLARVLELSTNVPTRISVRANSGMETWDRHFQAYRDSHALALVGFKPNRLYDLEITVYDLDGCGLEAPAQSLATAPLPSDFPPIEILESQPESMEPGYTIFTADDRDSGGLTYLTAVDSAGQVVWYTYTTLRTLDLRQLPNGHLLFVQDGNIVEMDFLAEILQTWDSSLSGSPPPGSIPVEAASFHHEVFPTQHGTLLSLSGETRVVENYPTSDTDPNAPTATADVNDNPVIEIAPATGQILNQWSLLDLLDPTRIGYLSLNFLGARGFDWGHANAVIHDPGDDSLIVSLRHQDATVKFSRSTGALQWILGPHENWTAELQPYLLTPVGEVFEWPYHQHAPMLTPQGTLILYDNGNFRASPFHGEPVADEDNYSRAVEYAIDEQLMEITQVWEHGGSTSEILYSNARSDADWLATTGNLLITHGTLRFIDGVPTNGTAVRIIEVDRNGPAQASGSPASGETVFELSIHESSPGWSTYRSERIRDFYPPPISVGLTADQESPAQLSKVGTVLFTAAAAGGTGSYEYQFWLTDPAGTPAMVQDYGGGEAFAWTPDAAGSFLISARVRTPGSSALLEAVAQTHFDIVIDPPVTSVSLAADHASPVDLSEIETITFSADASGGIGSYEYLFRVRDPLGTWATVQDYGNGDSFPWSPAYEGTWRIEVWARNAGSPALWEATAEMPFEILPLFADGFESGDTSAWSAVQTAR